ncbi:MAG: hypothetical protein KAI47_25590 [Deltaproteobacteria bacterium]|nr:hypothetical protein [Deltaproteobacteria bacterium]
MRNTRPAHVLVALIAALLVFAGTVFGEPARSGRSTKAHQRAARRLSLQRVDREPAEGRDAPSPKSLAKMKQAAQKSPRDRAKRFALVQGLRRAGQLKAAIAEAKRWRQHDAYNLVVVRLLGDLYSELGETAAAQRAYSAVVELLPEDPEAQRALATVLKQGGQLQAAYDRLVAAATLRPKDTRIAFELADTAQRLNRRAESIRRFEAIVNNETVSRQIVYPAKQRLGQLYAQKRRHAQELGETETETVEALTNKIAALHIAGGVRNDIKVYLTWDTNRTDVDLWVKNPSGEKVYYRHKRGRLGGALFHDVTDGYGPESFTAKHAARGTYLIQVNYFGTSRRTFSEARGEIIVVLHEGTAREVRHILPYRLYKTKQTVTVARVRVRVP